jgi:predicted alpha-1,6-mannanase (GH76 family)
VAPFGAGDGSPAADRAAAAEAAVLGRHVRRVLGLPGTALGVNSWPASRAHRFFLGWNYWWQAHLLDCMVDAEIRDPSAARRRLVSRTIRGIRVMNGGRWTNAYYDDMAWLGLALGRADRWCGTTNAAAIGRLTGRLLDGWSDAEGGGIPRRLGDVFKNAPANGPAAILLASTGHLDRAAATADWLDARLRDPLTGLVWDGLRPGADGRTQFEKTIYTYCQGVVLGAELELAQRLPGRTEHARRIHRLVAAVRTHLTSDGVLVGHAGGDSGLFTGILARYLALVATDLPGDDDAAIDARATAHELVCRSADAAWSGAATQDGLPLFGPEWPRPASRPSGTSDAAERDLSVQLAGWMLMEAAHRVGTGRSGKPSSPNR